MESFARLVVLAVGAALVVALIRDGPGGPTRWLKAKFLGETETADARTARTISAAGVKVTAADIAGAGTLVPGAPGTPANAIPGLGPFVVPPARPRAARPTTPRTPGGAIAVR